MAEHTRRVLIVVGAEGSYGEVDPDRINWLPLEVEFSGSLQLGDSVNVMADEMTTNYFVDLHMTNVDSEEAVARAADSTQRALRGLNMAGIAIKAARVTEDVELFNRFPDYAWPDMDDYSDMIRGEAA